MSADQVRTFATLLPLTWREETIASHVVTQVLPTHRTDVVL